MKLKNSNCDETQKNSNSDKTQTVTKLKLRQKLKKNFFWQNLNCEKTYKLK